MIHKKRTSEELAQLVSTMTLEEALRQTERHGAYLIKISDRWTEGKQSLSNRLRNTADLLNDLAKRIGDNH